MVAVTVDTEDLEALLFATSGIKELEAALDQRKRNPMVTSGMGRLAGAHDRLGGGRIPGASPACAGSPSGVGG